MFVRLLLGFLCILGCAHLADASPFAYVANYNGSSVTVIDLSNNSVSATIQLPDTQNPYGVAVNKFGSRVYVSNGTGNKISVIDTSNNSVSSIDLQHKSSGLAVDPAGTRLYVAHPDDGIVTVVNTLTGAVIKTVSTGGAEPQGVAVRDSGQNGAADRVYVANSASGTITVFDATADSMSPVTLNPVSVQPGPMGLALNPAGTRLYVACATLGKVVVIDTATNTQSGDPIDLGSIPFGVAANPDGSEVYVTLAGSLTGDGGSVAAIRTSDNTVTATFDVGRAPMGIAVTPTGAAKIVAVNSEGPSASVAEAVDKVVDATVGVGDYPETLGNFVGPELVPITLNAGYHGTITPVDPITVDPATNILKAPKGSPLRLNITADTNFAIGSVTLDGVDFPSPYTISTVTIPQTVAATFTRTKYTIYVLKTGTGSGTVYSIWPYDPNFSCGANCNQTYNVGEQVKIKGTASSGSVFAGFQGSGCAGVSQCNITMDGVYADVDGNYYLTAVFASVGGAGFQGAYDNLAAPGGGTINCDATYSAELGTSFLADDAKPVTVVPASPTTTLNLPASSTTGVFTISAGTITFSGGGAFIIN